MAAEEDPAAVRRDVLVTPQHARDGPGVLVVHSGRGLTPFVESLCHQLAHQGYVAHALDLFDGSRPTSVDDAQRLKATLDRATLVDRLEDGVQFLGDFRGVSRPAIGVLGLGFGGELALRLVDRSGDGIVSVTVYYGFYELDWRTLPVNFLGHFAGLDPEIPREELTDASQAAAETPYRTEFELYAEATPSFFEEEETARFDASAAKTSWNRTLEFFEETLYG